MDGFDATQPLILSQPQPEIDPLVHARLISLVDKTSPSTDIRTESIHVGRNPGECEVVVSDPRVSGKHIRIYRDKFAYYVEALSSSPTFLQGQQMKQGEVRTLASGNSLSLLFNTAAENPRERVADFLFQIMDTADVNSDNKDAVESRYQILQELGSGNFSKVLLGIDKENGLATKVAIKKINVEVFEAFRKKRGTKLNLSSEMAVMKGLTHKNMVQFIDSWQTANDLYLVMELCEGGDLLHNVLEQGAFPEFQGRRLFRECLGAVKYLHDRNIVHRDLKPENVLLTTSSRTDMVAKITDFGLAVQLEGAAGGADFPAVTAHAKVAATLQQLKARATMCRTFCGTPHYFAPEVIQSGRAESGAGASYGKEVDMWSMGVMLYIILSSVPPFDDESGDMEGLYSRICGGEWEFDVEEFDRVSAASKDLVTCLLKVKTRERLTVDKALKHKWFSILAFEKKASDGPAPAPQERQEPAAQPALKRLKTADTKESTDGTVTSHRERKSFGGC